MTRRAWGGGTYHIWPVFLGDDSGGSASRLFLELGHLQGNGNKGSQHDLRETEREQSLPPHSPERSRAPALAWPLSSKARLLKLSKSKNKDMALSPQKKPSSSIPYANDVTPQSIVYSE